eukprot:scaffold9.g2994.t1
MPARLGGGRPLRRHPPLLALALAGLAAARLAAGVVDTRYYDVLGIGADADDRTIQKAYRRVALRYHPDRNPDKPDAEEKFREVAAAYEVLSDPGKRRLYDQLGEEGMNRRAQGGGGPGGGFHFQHGDPFNIFETVFGGMGGSGGQRVRFQFGGGGGGGFPGGGGGGFPGGAQFHFQQGGGGGFPGGGQQGGGRGGGGAGLYDSDAFVADLTDDTFPDADGDGWIWLIECGHCRQLAPKWRRLAEALNGVVKVAAVNCEAQQALCQQHGIRGYPTIKTLAGGKLQ